MELDDFFSHSRETQVHKRGNLVGKKFRKKRGNLGEILEVEIENVG